MRRLPLVVMGLLGVVVLASVAHGQTRGGFDGSGHLLMHGTPRFVLGVYDSGGTYSNDSAFWENAIFSPSGPRGLQGFPLNVYLNYWLGAMPIGPTNTLLDVLHGHGMMYLQTGNCFADGSWTRYGTAGFSIASQSYVQQFAQHPAALGYYIMDECDDALIPETQQHYQQLKSWDPQGVALATALAAAYRDPSLWVNAADVLAIDPYPLYGAEPTQGYPHFTVADFTAKLRAAAPADRPVWTVLQFFKFTTDSRMLTAGELRSHAVMAIVEGAQGLFWWDIGVNGLRQLDAAAVSTSMSDLKTLTSELASLEPALLAASADGALVGNSTRFSDPIAGRIAQLQHNIAVEILYSRVQADQAEIAALQAGDTSKSPLLAGAANVRTRTKIVNGVGYVFAYNYTNLQQPVTFTWQSSVTSVRESKSGAAYGVNGASWSDTFGPYESRIYVINATTPPPPPPPPAELGVSFTNPASGATVSGTATVTMAAAGGTGTGYGFRLAVDGTTVYSGTNPSFGWNTTAVANGSRMLTGTVTDSGGASATATRTVTVSNTPPPSVSFTASFSYPTAGATVNGAQTVGMATTATWGQAKTFTLSVDGTAITSQTLTGTTLWYTWDTTPVANGARTLTLAVTMDGQTATATLPVTISNAGSPTAGPLVAAVLPSSRSVSVGTSATAFATIINAGTATATGCGLSPLTSVAATFSFQTTNPANNTLTGTPNTPVDIPAGGRQTYVFGFTPTGAIPPTEVSLSFSCANAAAAPVTPGVNTFSLAASATPVPDTIAQIATISGDGVVRISSSGGLQLFAIGTSNVGATGTITVSADTGPVALPLTVAVCETDAAGNCLALPSATVTVTYAGGTNRSFKFLVQASGSIPFSPAVNRVFVRLRTPDTVQRGATSAAVCTGC